ncbi:MAG: phosphate ABC transporter permease PstA [Alphaproteobacteria bacterium]
MIDHAQKGSDAHKRLKRRYRAEWRFRTIGIGAVLLALAVLALLLFTIVRQGWPAFTYHYVTLKLDLSAGRIDAQDLRQGEYRGIIRDAVDGALPFVSGRTDRRASRGLVSESAEILLRERVAGDVSLIGQNRDIQLPVSDTADLYLKNLVTTRTSLNAQSAATPTGTAGSIQVLANSNAFAPIVTDLKESLGANAGRLEREAAGIGRSLDRQNRVLASLKSRLAAASDVTATRLEESVREAQSEITTLSARRDIIVGRAAAVREQIDAAGQMSPMDPQVSSYFVAINNGLVRITHVSTTTIRGDVYLPLASTDEAAAGAWRIEKITEPEISRKISDKEIAYLDRLVEQGIIDQKLNRIFFTRGASREPEFAGILGAAVGSLLTMIVTLSLAFPLGVAAAIYLQEFAPRNRFTTLIEVNINNLAAVPSIVFGLLGLAVFLNVLALPRSAPIVGGLVLALMTLPTIIIAARAALAAVPPSIREAALSIGASRIQAVFHHVLPLAMPGILTGTIIGMAQALGETAPLLMIGMVAFIVDIPGGFLDPATVLPVQIFMWADLPEQAFAQKTAAAIMVLLIFLVMMNAAAVVLRKKFERRW